MSVQFSELHTVKGKLAWSPSGELLATTEANQLMIRQGDSLQIIGVHSCVDLIDKIEWSSNSEYILCLVRKRGLVYVWSISDVKYEAKIEEGLAGLTNAFWSPCNQHIITVSQFEIRLTIWSLLDGTANYIKYPKHNQCGLRFSSNGQYLAVMERSNHIDILGIYSVKYWQLIHRFNVDGLSDVHDVYWSHNDQYILCVNSELLYKFAVYTPRGRKVFEHCAYENALGIRCVAWSHHDRYLAIGSFDNQVRVFNTMTWRVVSQLRCQGGGSSSSSSTEQQYKTKSTIGYQEVVISNNYTSNSTSTSNADSQIKNSTEAGKNANVEKTRYVLKEIGAIDLSATAASTVASKHNDDVDGLPPIGISKCEWSFDSRFLAVTSESTNKLVWIWDMKYLVFHSILAHKQAVHSIAWNNKNQKLQLAISCNTDRLYLWSKSGSVVIRVVASRFNVRKLAWRPTLKRDSNKNSNDENVPLNQNKRTKRSSNYFNLVSKDCICLIDRNHFCCCYDLDF